MTAGVNVKTRQISLCLAVSVIALCVQGCYHILATQETLLEDSAEEKYEKGDFAGAIRDYNKAIGLNPGYGVLYRDRALAREAMGDFTGAMKDMDTAVALRPWDLEMSRIRVEAQIAILDSLQSPATNSAAADKVLLRMQIVTARIRIIEILDKLIRLQRNYGEEDPQAYGDRARLRFDQGDARGAIEDFDEVLEMDYNAEWAFYNRGLAEAVLGDDPAAIRDFTRVLKNDDSDGEAFYQRGLARIHAGDYERGCSDLRRAMSLGVEESESAMEEMCQ